MTTPTNNAVPSTNPNDLLFNAEKLDEVVNSSSSTYTDRLGAGHRTIAGIDAAADLVLGGLGYAPPVAYASGISLTLSTQTIEYGGEVYAPKVSALPFTTSAWATDSTKLRLIQGVESATLSSSSGASIVGYGDATVEEKLQEVDLLIPHVRTQKPASYSFPRLMKTLQEYRHDLQNAINIVGFGSSVGVGATLPDAATQAPVAHFVSKLKSALDPAGLYNFVKFNDSVNGSALTQALTALNSAVSGGHTPKLCVLAYGMNDSGVALYNAGQTFPFVYSTIIRFVMEAKKLGSDVVLMTTPHHKCNGFSYYMPDGVSQSYPTTISAPVTPEQLQPPASQSNIAADFLGTGQIITASHRHLRVNQAMRQAATDAGVPLIDVERYWFKAVAKYGEAALFNSGETLHPNLLGHQLSYWLAIDEFLESLAWQTGQEGQEPRANGLFGVNNALPEASLDISPHYYDSTLPPLQVKAHLGATDGNGIKANAVVWKVDPNNGDLVGYGVKTTDSTTIEVYRHHVYIGGGGAIASIAEVTESVYGGVFKTVVNGNYSLSGTVTVTTLPDNSMGTIWISGYQSGIGRKRIRVEWVSSNGVVTLGAIDSVGANVFSGPTVSGLNIQVTLTASGTTIKHKLDSVT